LQTRACLNTAMDVMSGLFSLTLYNTLLLFRRRKMSGNWLVFGRSWMWSWHLVHP